jgi:hypothetical protein
VIKEHDRIILRDDIPGEGLERGDVGTVVHIYPDGEAYVVEFFSLDGDTIAVVTLENSQVRPVTSQDITHARSLERI